MPSHPPAIRWINHASFILSCGDVRLITDPWLFGRAFNDGWAHLSESAMSMDDFRDVTHIWFSHEHPDHFSPPVLQRIAERDRARIQVIFQETLDRKVVRHCQTLGFTVHELPTHEWFTLSPDVRVMCGKVPYIDSWLLIDAGGKRILNANDCVVDGAGIASEIAAHTGDVDVLLTQFSYANWIGNPGDVGERRAAAREKLHRVQLQVDAFRPRFVIPFASMVYFCHAENAYLNDMMNSVRDAHDFIQSATPASPVVLYPGDCWEVGSPHDSERSLARYDCDGDLTRKNFVTSSSVAFEDLARLSQSYGERIRRANNRLMMWGMHLPPLRYFQPVVFRLQDLNTTVSFAFSTGLSVTPDAVPDVTLGSQSLAYAFQFDWGYETLEVNGRFNATPEGHKKLVKTFFVGPLNNTGRYLKLRTFLDRRFLARAWAKVRSLG